MERPFAYSLTIENSNALGTSLLSLVRVLDAVNWDVISKGDPDAWLYFYEMFLEVYDNDLRKQTGSYYAAAGGAVDGAACG